MLQSAVAILSNVFENLILKILHVVGANTLRKNWNRPDYIDDIIGVFFMCFELVGKDRIFVVVDDFNEILAHLRSSVNLVIACGTPKRNTNTVPTDAGQELVNDNVEKVEMRHCLI